MQNYLEKSLTLTSLVSQSNLECWFGFYINKYYLCNKYDIIGSYKWKERFKTQLAAWEEQAVKLLYYPRRKAGWENIYDEMVGRKSLSKWVYFNFDERPEIKHVFWNNKDVNRISVHFLLSAECQMDENTLVVFDEIQECPNALNTLKYFAEVKSKSLSFVRVLY